MIKLVTRPLWQWSTGRFVRIVPAEGTIVDEVHFYNGTTRNALIGVHKADGDAIISEIPNILLQSENNLTVYAMMTDDTGETTVECTTFGVSKRPKPDDYVYSETEVKSWYDLVSRVEALEKNGGASYEQIKNAVNEYLLSNPVSAGATKEQAEQIEKNKQEIESLREDKLSTEQLGESIEDALGKAKESGMFDGDDGVSPVIEVTLIENGYRIKIMDASGAKTIDVMNGEAGKDGKDGANGEDGLPGAPGKDGLPGVDGIGIVSIKKTNTVGLVDTYTITLSDGGTSTFTVTNGRDGDNTSGPSEGGAGEDGYSPIAIVVQDSDGATISITDINGTTTATVKNGKDGADGADGSPGKDGVNGITPHVGSNGNWFIGENDTGVPATGPAGNQGLPGEPGEDGTDGVDGKDGASATHSWNGTVLSITSASGTSSADLKGEKGDIGPQGPQGEKGDAGEQGPKGDKGNDGANGTDGYSPVRGKDYYTAEDIEAMIAEIFNRVVNANEVMY